jgi:hypothetical protein
VHSDFPITSGPPRSGNLAFVESKINVQGELAKHEPHGVAKNTQPQWEHLRPQRGGPGRQRVCEENDLYPLGLGDGREKVDVIRTSFQIAS